MEDNLMTSLPMVPKDMIQDLHMARDHSRNNLKIHSATEALTVKDLDMDLIALIVTLALD